MISKLKEKPPGILRGVFRIFDLLVRLRILHEHIVYLPENIYSYQKIIFFVVEEKCASDRNT